ncbi:phosphotransferase family protein [uncultured Olsenella sp.]|uniref:phosphotransferase family protein n=1 Tax=uncultured Olsenella sp. TaxID=190764 RepID=UPI0026DCE9B2|nr:aminoglycoside phosphotransferase family protein [uncultured Olsenella sp.]
MKLSDGKVELARRGNKVVYHDGDRLVKVFNSEKPAADVFNEALNLARVQGVGIRVPEVLEVSRVEEGEHKGSWALATRYVHGVTLLEVAQGDPEGRGRYLEQLVDLQAEVHSFEAPLLNRQKDKLARMIASCKGIDPSVRYDLEMRVDGMKPGMRVCHGDFVPSNVIVSEDGNELYVCDWAHVTAGLPELDAAMTYLLFSLEDPELAEEYLVIYSRRTDTPKQVVHYWLPVVAAAELSRNRKVNEEKLAGMVNVGDYE